MQNLTHAVKVTWVKIAQYSHERKSSCMSIKLHDMTDQLNRSSFEREEILTVTDARNLLKCSRGFLHERRKAGEIKAIKLERKVLFLKSSLMQYLRNKVE